VDLDEVSDANRYRAFPDASTRYTPCDPLRVLIARCCVAADLVAAVE
jgi:hypothetical protein